MLKVNKLTEYDLHYMKDSSLFAGLGKSQLKAIEPIISIYEYNRREEIFKEKSNGTEIFMILRGQIEIIKKHGVKGKFLMTVLTAKDFFGEMSFLTGSRRSASAVSRTDCRLLSLHPENLEKAILSDQHLDAILITNIAKKLALNLESLNNEYSRMMSLHSDFFNDHHKKEICDLSDGISTIRSKYLR